MYTFVIKCPADFTSHLENDFHKQQSVGTDVQQQQQILC